MSSASSSGTGRIGLQSRGQGPSSGINIRISETAGYHDFMSRIPRRRAAFSKISVKNQTVIPREVREQLKLKPGDTLRYCVTDDGILLDKATENGDNPFTAFSEWTSEAYEKAHGGL
jgi:antitoxin PrlF